MSNFKEISIKDFPLNPFEIKNKWMLITAAKADGTVNTMTASWGSFGVMWNKEVVFVVIRPQRYTKEFVDNAESFSLSFFDNDHKKALAYLGKVSGRDENKIEKAELTVLKDNSVPYFAESETVILARKLFAQPIEAENFLNKDLIKEWYPENDFHILYIGEITKILAKTE